MFPSIAATWGISLSRELSRLPAAGGQQTDPSLQGRPTYRPDTTSNVVSAFPSGAASTDTVLTPSWPVATSLHTSVRFNVAVGPPARKEIPDDIRFLILQHAAKSCALKDFANLRSVDRKFKALFDRYYRQLMDQALEHHLGPFYRWAIVLIKVENAIIFQMRLSVRTRECLILAEDQCATIVRRVLDRGVLKLSKAEIWACQYLLSTVNGRDTPTPWAQNCLYWDLQRLLGKRPSKPLDTSSTLYKLLSRLSPGFGAPSNASIYDTIESSMSFHLDKNSYVHAASQMKFQVINIKAFVDIIPPVIAFQRMYTHGSAVQPFFSRVCIAAMEKLMASRDVGVLSESGVIFLTAPVS